MNTSPSPYYATLVPEDTSSATKTSPAPSGGQAFEKPGLHTTADVTRALGLMQKALAVQFGRPPMAGPAAQVRAAQMVAMAKTIAQQVGARPELLGSTLGISNANAAVIGSRVTLELTDQRLPSQSTAEANEHAELVRNFLTSTLARGLIGAATTSWAGLVAQRYDVIDGDGNMSFPVLASASGKKVQYYPAAILSIGTAIQAAYNRVPIRGAKSLAPYLDLDSVKVGAQNSVVGHFQAVLPFLAACVLKDVPAAGIRHERRAFTQGTAPAIKDVIVASSATMRIVLASLLAMSIATGDVQRTMSLKGSGAAKKAIYTIKANSRFEELIDLICEYKRYYNVACQTKDLPAYVAAKQGPDSLLAPGLMWSSAVRDADRIVITTSAITVELETRARIGDYNNSRLLDQNNLTKSPSATVLKLPAYTYFMKYPNEARTARDILETRGDAGRGDLSINTLTRLEQFATAKYGNATKLASVAADIYSAVDSAMRAHAMINLLKHISAACSAPSVTAAIVDKEFK